MLPTKYAIKTMLENPHLLAEIAEAESSNDEPTSERRQVTKQGAQKKRKRQIAKTSRRMGRR